MSATPWMPFYIADYRADTNHLSAAQHGAYLLLIMHYWQQGGLPDDDAQLSRIAAMSLSEWRRHRSVIRQFFRDGWRHGRIDHEIEETKTKIEARSRAGRKGNEKRWSRAERASQTDRNAIANGSQSQPHTHPLRGNLDQGKGTLNGSGRALGSGRRLAVVNGGLASDEEVGF